MQEATSLRSCLQCDLSFPVSRLPHHIRETHGDKKVTTSDDGATSSKDEEMGEESEEDYYDESMEEDITEDIDLEINDDDVNDYLKNLAESQQKRVPDDNAPSETQEENVEETVPRVMCELPFKKPDLKTI